jgi:hypothetical protein
MKNLSITEKYRPKNLAALRGHARIVAMLKSFTKNPCSKAFLFSGPAGTGKTSAAYAIAGELGCDFSASREMSFEYAERLARAIAGKYGIDIPQSFADQNALWSWCNGKRVENALCWFSELMHREENTVAA